MARNLTISTDTNNEFVELKGTFLFIEPVLESEDKITLENGESGSSSAFLLKTMCLYFERSVRTACWHIRWGTWENTQRMARHPQTFKHPKCFYCFNKLMLRLPVFRKRETKSTLIILQH